MIVRIKPGLLVLTAETAEEWADLGAFGIAMEQHVFLFSRVDKQTVRKRQEPGAAQSKGLGIAIVHRRDPWMSKRKGGTSNLKFRLKNGTA